MISQPNFFRYDIMNYQRLENGSFDYVRVGQWDNGTLLVQEEKVIFNKGATPPTSVCSEPCLYNEYKVNHSFITLIHSLNSIFRLPCYLLPSAVSAHCSSADVYVGM